MFDLSLVVPTNSYFSGEGISDDIMEIRLAPVLRLLGPFFFYRMQLLRPSSKVLWENSFNVFSQF